MGNLSKNNFVTTYDLASIVLVLLTMEKYLNPIIVIVILGTSAGLFITYRIRKDLKEDNNKVNKIKSGQESGCTERVCTERVCTVEHISHQIDDNYEEEEAEEEAEVEEAEDEKVDDEEMEEDIEEELMEGLSLKMQDYIYEEDLEAENI